MTESGTSAAEPVASAGTLLRRAREKQGLHIAVLAASIKVSPRKLEALEADRYQELPDLAFARALAQTVCRSLKIDPATVLALLPRPDGRRLEQVAEGINAPFHDRGAPSASAEWTQWLRPAVVLPLLIVIAAAVVWLLPLGRSPAPPVPLPSASAPVATGTAPLAGTARVADVATASAPAAPAPRAAPASAPAEPTAAGPAVAEPPTPPPSTLQIRASAPSWVEVIDGAGRSVISRIIDGGETVDLDGALPLRVRVGNAAATQLSFRGQAVDLGPATRENVARLELR